MEPALAAARAPPRPHKQQRANKFIYDLSHREHKDIEDMLNMGDIWETLAGEHLVPPLRLGEIDRLRRYNLQPGTSAAKALLDHLGNRNTTIVELFMLLHKVELYRGMDILRPHVPEKLQSLIPSGGALFSLNSSPAVAAARPAYPAVAPVPGKAMPSLPAETAEFTRSHNCGPAVPAAVTARAGGETMADWAALDRARHLSETTAGSSMTGSSVTSGVPTVTHHELALACQNWREENKIGEGGFGQVYKGIWKHQEVAIKTLKKDRYLAGAEPEQYRRHIIQFFQEISFLSRLRSEYIVPIIAHSEANHNGTMEPCIVYQWMPNGSLDDRLQKKGGTPALTWQQRFNIAVGTANGIQFLHNHDHSGKQLIHGDIKSANILLDRNFEPKLGDFGLAREVDGEASKHFTLTTIYGTQFYLPQDFLRSKKLNSKVDTYSFGVILFDLVTGKRPQTRVGPAREYLLDIMRESACIPGHLVDVSWPGQAERSHLCKILYIVGKECTADRAKRRPEMEEVFQNLQKAGKQSEQSAPTPYELQQRFDSLERGPAGVAGLGPGGAGRVVALPGGMPDLIDLSSPAASGQTGQGGQAVASISCNIPATVYANLPAVVPGSDNMDEIPAMVNSDLSSCSTLRDSQSMERIEQDIEQSAEMLSSIGFS